MSGEEDWMREKRALEERIRQLEMQQQAPPQPPPPSTGLLHTARMPSDDEIAQMFDKVARLIPESSNGANELLVKHLTTIVSNLLIFPYTEPKYRKLRVSNPRLASELMSHPSALPCLRLIGFRDKPDDNGEACLMVPPSDADHITLLRAVKGSLPRLTQRDEVAAEAAKRFAAFRKSVAFEVRMERLAHETSNRSAQPCDEDDVATAPRLVDEYVVTSLCWNDSEIGKKIVTLLRTITQNILKEPGNDRFRSLLLSSNTLRDTVFPAQGSVEYLMAILGFEWADDGMRLAPFQSEADFMQFKERAERGLALLDAADKAVEEKRVAENALRRAAALAERDAEMRRQQTMKPPSVDPRSDSTATSAAPPAPSTAGKRIPISEALKVILGKKKDEEDW